MKIFKNSHKRPSLLKSLSLTSALFLGAYLLDNSFTDLNIYPLYLASILYSSINISFYFAVPLTLFSAYLSVTGEGLSSFSFANILLIRMALLVIIAYLFCSYFELAITYRRRFELLKGLVPQCPDCGAIMCNDGKWRNLEEISGKPELLEILAKHECGSNSKSFHNEPS